MSIPRGETWARAMDSLHRFVPDAKSFSPDEIAQAAAKSNKPVNWRQIPDFDSLDDTEIWQIVKPTEPTDLDEKIILIADACFIHDDGPFITTYAELDTLIENFIDNHNDEVFGGDVIILFPSSVLVVHHEGLVAEVR